jgi:hypothetical protein
MSKVGVVCVFFVWGNIHPKLMRIDGCLTLPSHSAADVSVLLLPSTSSHPIPHLRKQRRATPILSRIEVSTHQGR